MSLISKVAGLYQKSISKSFGMYGLKYDDALVDTAAVQTALHWINGEDYQARTKRIARATDCSLKRCTFRTRSRPSSVRLTSTCLTRSWRLSSSPRSVVILPDGKQLIALRGLLAAFRD
ncbi:hypothetical protein P3T76_013254 [Phytophthora citrophthora]|uniref:Uncharacterized protein n=1 Tax=Phytophthora citrophthora TaxID=4793 RepID=A0AAD9G3H4_9STRA|nr:hypothetical protein P3T76_013254 [Phytophthora citrophthora]